MGPIGKGTVAGYRFELIGMVGAEARIAVEHITRIHPDFTADELQRYIGQLPAYEPGAAS
jgi:hypothetical protein